MRIDFFSQGLLVKSTFEDIYIFEDSLYILEGFAKQTQNQGYRLGLNILQ